jgi:predicted nucleic acid-binding protein
MTAPVFVDTNVLVCARDRAQGDKHRRALAWMTRLWDTRTGRLSHQVLSEYYVTVTARLKPGMPAAAARRDVRALLAWHPIATTGAILERAWDLQDRHQLPWWDALIVASTRAAGCGTLLTEDFQDGQRFGDLEVVSPFRAA